MKMSYSMDRLANVNARSPMARSHGYHEPGRSPLSTLIGFVLALWLLSCILPSAVGQLAGVYGRVKDINGNPLSGVIVTVYDTSGSLVARTQTLLGGDFSVSLDRGTYRVLMEKKGYESKSITLSVTRVYAVIDLGDFTLDYGLKLSVTQTYLRVNCLSEVSIPATIRNSGPQDEPVRLSVDAPEGWDVGTYSGLAEVKELTLTPTEVQSFDLRVQVPYDSSGLYNLTVRASGWTVQQRTISIYVDKIDPQVVTSKYPIARATPSSTLTFELTIKNILTRRFTGLVFVELPTEWTGSVVREDGSVLFGLSLEPGDLVRAILKLDVPGTASPGDYVVIVFVKTPDFESSLRLNVTVVTGMPRLRLRTDTPYIDAYAGRAAEYLIVIENTGDSDGIVNIDLEGLPAGYSWVIKDASGSVVSKLYLKAGESKQLRIAVTVPPLAEPDIKSFALEVEAGGAIDRLNLGLGILGWYSIAYVTQNFYAESFAGTSTTFQITVRNTGYSSLTNVRLEAADIPDKFEVRVDPNVVLLLNPQDTATFSLTIITDADISAGDYYVTLNLTMDQSQIPVRNLHVYVKQRGEVVYIGAGIAITVVAALFLIYRRYGRR